LSVSLCIFVRRFTRVQERLAAAATPTSSSVRVQSGGGEAFVLLLGGTMGGFTALIAFSAHRIPRHCAHRPLVSIDSSILSVSREHLSV
jgi:hypothetical protein